MSWDTCIGSLEQKIVYSDGSPFQHSTGANVNKFEVAPGFKILTQGACCRMFGGKNCNAAVHLNFFRGPFTSADGELHSNTPQVGGPNCMYAIDAFPADKAGFDGGSVFLILVFVGGGVYCGAGIALGRRKGLSGIETVPNRAFWGAIPGLARDGCGYFFWCWKKRVGMSVAASFQSYEEL